MFQLIWAWIFRVTLKKLTKRKNKLIIKSMSFSHQIFFEEGDWIEMLAQALSAGTIGLTESECQANFYIVR